MFRRSPQKMSETFEQLLEESLKGSVMQTGAVITAEVVDVNGDYVVVNAGLKSESEIPATQFRDADGAVSVKVGDFVEVAIGEHSGNNVADKVFAQVNADQVVHTSEG